MEGSKVPSEMYRLLVHIVIVLASSLSRLLLILFQCGGGLVKDETSNNLSNATIEWLDCIH